MTFAFDERCCLLQVVDKQEKSEFYEKEQQLDPFNKQIQNKNRSDLKNTNTRWNRFYSNILDIRKNIQFAGEKKDRVKQAYPTRKKFNHGNTSNIVTWEKFKLAKRLQLKDQLRLQIKDVLK